MSWIHALRQRLTDLTDAGHADRGLEEEIAYHLELETARQISRGRDAASARAHALARFGNPQTITDATRDERGTQPVEGTMQDLRWAIRSLRKSPGFTMLALFTLALGIGASTAAFTVLHTVLLRPLPYRDANRLVYIEERSDKQVLLPPSYPNFVSWRANARSFTGVASAMFPFARTVSPNANVSDAVRVQSMGVSRHFFATLGVAPYIGREFTDDENRIGGARAVMVSYEFWQGPMGARTPLGTIRVGDLSTPVVGVLPPNFRFVAPAEIYFPHEQGPGTFRSSHNYMVVARLAPTVALSAARADMSALSRTLLATYGAETQAVDASVVPLRDYLVADNRMMLAIVFGAATLVLLIACTNLVSAQLARGQIREREMIVRAALGASHRRLVRLLLFESGVLVACGAVLGSALAAAAVRVVRALGQNLVPRLNELAIDERVLTFIVVVAVVTTLIVGVYPALQLSRRNPSLVLRGGRSGLTVRAAVWRLLVGFEIALAVMLLIGSTLLVRTLHNILNADIGFDAQGVVTAAITPSEEDGPHLDQLLTDAAALPGVEGAAFTNKLPLSWGNGSAPVRRVGDPEDRDWPALAGFRLVSPGYFGVLHQRVLRGRAFAATDIAGAPGVAIITPGIAEALWPGQDAIGRRIATNYLSKQWLTVVGVVAEASSWTMPRGSQNEIYVPIAQHWGSIEGQVIAMIRTASDPQILISTLRARFRQLIPNSPAQYGTMTERIVRSASDRRFAMLALTAFGTIALVLSAVGIYGVIWYIVTTRTHEIGIRMALGATAAMVRREMLAGAAVMSAGGIAVGVTGGAVASRFLVGTLYGVSRLDPLTYVAGAAMALGAAMLAAYVPARRSSRIDPIVAMREE